MYNNYNNHNSWNSYSAPPTPPPPPLDAQILRCAKQVYHHLSMDNRIQLLYKQTLPPEVQKMKALQSLDPQELDNTVKFFLGSPHPESRKKNIGDFVQLLVKTIDKCAPSFDDLFEDTFSRDDSLKRTRAESSQYENVDNKRMRPHTSIGGTSGFSPSSSFDATMLSNSPMSSNSTMSNNYFTAKNTTNTCSPMVDSPLEMTPIEMNIRDLFSMKPNSRIAQANQDPKKNSEKQKEQVEKKERKKKEQEGEEEDEEDEEEEEVNTQSKFMPLEFLKGVDVITITSPPKQTKFVDKIPWFIAYEIARFVHTCEVPWDELPLQTSQTFLDAANASQSDFFDAMIEWNKARLKRKTAELPLMLLEKCAPQVWSFWNDIKEDTESNKKVKQFRDIRYTIALRAKISTKPPVHVFQPPTLSASNRFFRKFGSDRFLEMKYMKETHSSMIKKQQEYFLKPFVLMQRTFRFLFIKDSTLIFFATEGPGLKPISIKQVIEWHMPFFENWNMDISKYASRMSLGYSNSIPTIVFKPQQLEYIEDIYSSDKGINKENSCMTDGCGIISCSAMKKIMGCQVTDELPCAIQGRIAGAKGIWIIDPNLDFNSGDYIKIRASQNKFKTGMPQEDYQEDPLHYTFDLVKNSICIYPSNLNTQFIQGLAAGGVPTEVFQDLLKEYIHRIGSVIKENKNVKILRDWISKSGKLMGERWEMESNVKKGFWNSRTLDEFDFEDESDPFANNNSSYNSWTNILSTSIRTKDNKYSGQPGSPYEVVVRLLDSGFDLTNSYVANRITFIFREIMRSITTKYKIEVEQSCTVTCIPDPTGTLEPGEVFLQLSKRKKDESTGMKIGLITGDVIVTRNPCGLKSDIQKVKAVDCVALRMYTDVIVFPIKGSRSLASQLSGGDYDGDLIFCCWDERIVKPYTSSPSFDDTKRVNKAFIKEKGTVGSKISVDEKNTESIIQRCFMSVVIPDGTLGSYENWRTVLAEKTSLDNEEVVYLAQVCAKLVDAPKQGLRLKHDVKMKDKKLYSAIPYPAWFMDKRNKQRPKGKNEYKEVNEVYTIQNAPCETTMDYLYKTLLEETEEFTRYSKSIFLEEDIAYQDADLTAPWRKAKELSARLNDAALTEDIKLIEKSVRDNFNQYCTQFNKLMLENQRYADSMYNPRSYLDDKLVISSNGVDSLKFENVHEIESHFAKEFLEIPKGLKSDTLLCDIEANNGDMLKRIRASLAYELSIKTRKYSKYCYIVAFDVIRRIKSDACAKRSKYGTHAETVASSIYKSMSIDRIWVRRLKELQTPDEPDMKLPRIASKVTRSS